VGWGGKGFILNHVEKDWIFVSDAHFTGREPEETDAFLRFLDSERERMGHLVILGDLFEFFFGFKDARSKEKTFPFTDYLPTLEKLQSLYRQGIHIEYFEGNHDFFLRSLFSEYFNMDIQVHPDGAEEKLGGKRAFLAHGDLSNPKQWKYRAFRGVLKNRWTYGLIYLVGPRLSRQIAQRLSSMSYQKYHAGISSNPSPAFRAFAHHKFLEGFEIVILGHTHFPEEAEEWVDGRRCFYFNVGDWMTHRSFLRFTPPEHFELSRFIE
jgi:UDP-2,3-diacylglucosamine hydrolase